MKNKKGNKIDFSFCSFTLLHPYNMEVFKYMYTHKKKKKIKQVIYLNLKE